MADDEPIRPVCRKCNKPSYTIKCENEIVDKKTRVTTICNNVRPTFYLDKMTKAVGMVGHGVMSIGDGQAAWIMGKTRLGTVHPVGTISPELEEEYTSRIEAEGDKDKKKSLQKQLDLMRKNVITKDKIAEVVKELVPRENYVSGAGLPEAWERFKNDNKHYVVYRGYIVSTTHRKNALGEYILVCDDDSLDYENLPDDFRGVRVTVQSHLWELSLGERVADEAEIIAIGQINKWKDYYPSVRCQGITILDGGGPEEIIRDVTEEFAGSDFADTDDIMDDVFQSVIEGDDDEDGDVLDDEPEDDASEDDDPKEEDIDEDEDADDDASEDEEDEDDYPEDDE